MRKLVVLTGMALAISTCILAAPVTPCASGTYASYIALASTGCSVGDQLFFGFNSLTVPGTSTAVSAGAITVAPITTALMPGLLFTLNLNSTSIVTPEAFVGFDVTPLAGATNVISGSTLTQIGGSATGTGGVTGVETLCLGAALTATGTCPSPGTPGSRNLGVFAIAPLTQASDLLATSPRSLVGATGDFSVDGGPAGTASVMSFSETFSEIAAPTVPEPATILLTGCALLGLGFGRRLHSRGTGR